MQPHRNPARPSSRPTPEPVRAYTAMNTVRALEQLAFTSSSAPELANALGVSVRTARRLLQRLALEGFVTQERGHRRRYHATRRLAVLGRQLLNHSRFTHTAAPRVAQLAHDTTSTAHLWIHGYNNQLVCVLHADAQAGEPTISILSDVAPAAASAPGTVLLEDRAQLRSYCYLHVDPATEPTAAAAVLHRGHVVAALAVSGDHALDAAANLVNAAAQLCRDLSSTP